MNETPYMVFAGTKSRYLAEEICKELGCQLGQMNTTHFADGEFAVSYEESIRGKNVFLVQSTFPNSDNLMELLLMVDAAKRASAKSIVAVMNAREPAQIVETYAIPAVEASVLPAPVPRSAIPGTIKPTMMSGITKLRNWLKIALYVARSLTGTSVPTLLERAPITIPRAIAIISFGSKPIFFMIFQTFLKFFLLFVCCLYYREEVILPTNTLSKIQSF